jgi:hypothetical protein
MYLSPAKTGMKDISHAIKKTATTTKAIDTPHPKAKSCPDASWKAAMGKSYRDHQSQT